MVSNKLAYLIKRRGQMEDKQNSGQHTGTFPTDFKPKNLGNSLLESLNQFESRFFTVKISHAVRNSGDLQCWRLFSLRSIQSKTSMSPPFDGTFFCAHTKGSTFPNFSSASRLNRMANSKECEIFSMNLQLLIQMAFFETAQNSK